MSVQKGGCVRTDVAKWRSEECNVFCTEQAMFWELEAPLCSSPSKRLNAITFGTSVLYQIIQPEKGRRGQYMDGGDCQALSNVVMEIAPGVLGSWLWVS